MEPKTPITMDCMSVDGNGPPASVGGSMRRPVVLEGGPPEALLVLATNMVSTVLMNTGSITRGEKQTEEQSEAAVGRCPLRRAIEEVDQSHGAG
jgi:hypothetical protein